MSPRGFTIVELLVVVAIVAVLAAIAIPAVGFGIARADSTKCLGNLRAMGVGLNAWLADQSPVDLLARALPAELQAVLQAARADRFIAVC